jgi:four helix bundle protein
LLGRVAECATILPCAPGRRPASLSIQLNIAEGYTNGDSPTFTKHLGIAYGSAVETGELLRLALDTDLIGVGPLKALLERTQETERILLGMLKHRRKFKA